MHKCHGTGSRSHVRDMRLPLHPGIQNEKIGCQNGAVSREDLFFVRQGERRDLLIEEPAAHKVIVPHTAKLGERLPVMGRKPAETKPGQRKGLRHRSGRDPLLIEIANGGSESSVDGNATVHLIAKKVCATLTRDGDDVLQHVRWNQSARWIVRIVEADHTHAARRCLRKLIKVRQIAVLSSKAQHRHLRPERFRCRVKLLIAWRECDHTVPRADEGEEDVLVPARRTMLRQDLLRADTRIETTDLLLDLLRAEDGAVCLLSFKKAIHKICAILARQRKKLCERERLRTGVRDIVLGAFFVLVHPAFDAEL